MREAYKELRSEFVKSLKKDLIGPYDEYEELHESPATSYIMGRISPVDENIVINEDENSDFEDREKGFEEDGIIEMDDSEKIFLSKNKQSSVGLKVFLTESTKELIANVKWADYVHDESGENSEKVHVFNREPKEYERIIDISSGNLKGELIENNIYLTWIVHKFKSGNKMVSVYIENRRIDIKDNVGKYIFQVNLSLKCHDETKTFISETLAYEKMEADDYFYYKKPIFSRGYGCAASWEEVVGHTAGKIQTEFLPQQEINGMDADLKKFKNSFSMLGFSKKVNREATLNNLSDLLSDYALWISRLETHEYMKDENYQEIGNDKITLCNNNLNRMFEGLDIIKTNENAFKAFLFMNEAMHLSRSMAEYSKHKGENKKLDDFKDDHSFWRPFQIGFILLNIKGLVDQNSEDRNVLDLLYFPTGGGKTEAYLGVIAFLMAYRRLTRFYCDNFEKDGGVTVIIRYTLRLLTTQQRDRMLRLISATEILRQTDTESYGDKEFSVGFWVGSTVTINNYSNLIVSDYNKQYQVDSKKKNLDGQILKCPCCGSLLDKKSYKLDIKNRKYEIYCPNDICPFSKRSIPVYLIDEDIYSKTPTVIIGTVDKFARITFEERTHLIFGKRSIECSECGSMLNSDKELIKTCTKKGHLLERFQQEVRPFFPPELVLQDELHLITGPLGTIYGSYEMAVDELAKVEVEGKSIKPKYIASTATIKNADKQIVSLYGRTKFNQFPPGGHDSNDSYFAREKDLFKYPFRLYVGVSSPYASMKTTILRVYAILLQSAERYKDDPIYKDFIDPFWTLIGYYNSKRELGGAVRLIQDDIPDRMKVLYTKNKDKWPRRLSRYDEITSRKKSWEIPKVLETLENKFDSGDYVYDVAVATNMIQVGMDVERLGLMAVTGQPKTTAEYIQATSRIGRKTPGLVVTIYNPYRSRDLSHYENFTKYHSHLYRYVEGNSATPFSARARERCLHAAFIAMLRGKIDILRDNKTGARKIENISDKDVNEIIKLIGDRIDIVDPNNKDKAMDDIRYFYDEWIKQARNNKNLYYYIYGKNIGYKTHKVQRLLKTYGERGADYERDTLNSMRNVQKEAGLYLWED
jgi:Distinct helicase family with a unique C-terminal domain including a metal-binding cysteine cluster